MAVLLLISAHKWLAGTILLALLYSSQVTGKPASVLYVLSSPEKADPEAVPHSDVWFIDPGTGNILRSIKVGLSADMRVSPDSKKIYVSSSYVSSAKDVDRKCFLDTYDSVTGALLARVLNVDGQQFTSPVHDSAMALSKSGHWLYLVKTRTTGSDTFFYLSAYDTTKQTFLSDSSPLLGCTAPTLLPLDQDLTLAAVCQDSTYIRKVTFRPGMAPLRSSLQFPSDFADATLAAVVWDPTANIQMFISASGRVVKLDNTTLQMVELGSPLLNSDEPYFHRGLLALAKHEAFIGSGEIDAGGPEQFNQLTVIDSQDGRRLRNGSYMPFFSMALSTTGNTIFLLQPSSAKIALIDTSTLRETFSIGLPGMTPFYAEEH